MTIDVSGLQNRIFQLERELQFEKREKESMRAKYVLDLEEREKKHRKKIKEMEGEVEMLKKQLADSNRAISELRSEMHKEIAINKRQRARLLCGSVAYVYIESAGTFLLFTFFIGHCLTLAFFILQLNSSSEIGRVHRFVA